MSLAIVPGSFDPMTIGHLELIKTVAKRYDEVVVAVMVNRSKRYLFDMATVAVIISSFYFSCIRDPVQVFLNAYGIFEKSGYMTLCRAAVNFVLSIM